jgi:hypothetical protein
MIKTYSQPLRLKLIAVFGLLFFNVVLIFIFFEIIKQEYEFFIKINYILSCILFWIVVNYGLIEQLVEKVIITDESISLKTLFKHKNIFKKDIKEYKLKNTNIFLIPKEENIKGISFSDNLIDGDKNKLTHYISDNYLKKDNKEKDKWNFYGDE